MNYSVVISAQASSFKAATLQGDFEENVKFAVSCGYDGVELAIRDPSVIDGESYLDILSPHSIPVVAIGTGQAWGEEGLSYADPDPTVRQKAIDRVISHIPFAKKSGGVIIIGLVRGIVQNGISESQAREWMFDGFKTCVEEANKLGVRIAFEPLNRYETTLLNTAEEGLEFIDSVGSDNLGLLLDTFHMNIEEPSIEESIKTCGERIFHFHVADSNRCYPGAGHIDFKSALEALDSTGYKGFVSGEFLPQPDVHTSVRQSIQYLSGLL